MSGEGSDFSESDGEFLHEPSAKKTKLDDAVVESQVLQLHTDWVQRDTRRNAYNTGESDGPIPVPQSDFEIEINSSNQDGQNSEISLSSNSITIPMEPRILTIDTRLTSDSTSVHSEPVVTTTIVQQSNLHTSTTDIQPSHSPPVPSQTDFSSLIAAAGRSGLMQVPDQQSLISTGDLSSNQFILPSHTQPSTDGTQSSGPLYVMIPPSSNGAELLHAAMQHGHGGPRPIVPRLASGAIIENSDDSRKQKDYIRKQTHNEVERRRRDRINELIKMLAEIVPGCQKKDAANGNIVGYVYSKGTVLEKTVEYVRELYIQNEQLTATAKLAEKSANALQVLQNQISVLEKENAFLRAQMIQLGIDNTSSAISARTLFANPLTQSLLSSAQVQPSPPPPPPPVPNTTQLLVSLAQTLTSNPLLASLAQQSVPQPSSIPPSISTNDTQVHVTPSQHQTTNNQASLLMNSLVQTLASITGSSANTIPPPPPQPITQTQPAAAAMSLLNSLIMAQSALNAATSTSPSTAPSSSAPVNLLVTQNSPEKSTPA